MSKQNKKHPDPNGSAQVNPEDRPVPTAGQRQPDIQDGKNQRKRNNSPQQKDPEDEPDLNLNEEEPVEERPRDASSSL